MVALVGVGDRNCSEVKSWMLQTVEQYCTLPSSDLLFLAVTLLSCE